MKQPVFQSRCWRGGSLFILKSYCARGSLLQLSWIYVSLFPFQFQNEEGTPTHPHPQSIKISCSFSIPCRRSLNKVCSCSSPPPPSCLLMGPFPFSPLPLPPRAAIISPRCMKKKEENKGVGVDREGRGREGGPGDVQWLKSTRFGDPTGAEFTI